VVVHDVILDPGYGADRLRFRSPAVRELNPADLVMPGVTIGNGHKPNEMAEARIFDRDSARFDVTVVGMGADYEDAKLR